MRWFTTWLLWGKWNNSSHSYSHCSSDENYPTTAHTGVLTYTHTPSRYLSAPSLYISSWRGKALLTRQASAFSCSVALAVKEKDFFASLRDRIKCFNFPLAWRKWLHETFGVHRLSGNGYTEPEPVLQKLSWTLKVDQGLYKMGQSLLSSGRSVTLFTCHILYSGRHISNMPSQKRGST